MVQHIGASVLHSCYVPQVTVVERYSLVLSAQHFCHSSIWTFRLFVYDYTWEKHVRCEGN